LSQHEYKLNTFNKRMLDCMRELLQIDVSVSDFISNGTQESLNALCSQVDAFDQRWDNVKMSLVPLAKMIAGEDVEDVDVEVTDNGYKL